MKGKELSICDLIKRLNRLSVIDVMQGDTYNNVYMTHIKKYFNKEKVHYIYFTDLIHISDFNLILDHIDEHPSFNFDKLKEINDLINASTIKFCLNESLECSIVYVSVKINSNWAIYLSNEPVSGEKVPTIKESKNALNEYDFKVDNKRTYQQCISHIERLEKTVEMSESLNKSISKLNDRPESPIERTVFLESKRQKQELIEIIKGL